MMGSLMGGTFRSLWRRCWGSDETSKGQNAGSRSAQKTLRKPTTGYRPLLRSHVPPGRMFRDFLRRDTGAPYPTTETPVIPVFVLRYCSERRADHDDSIYSNLRRRLSFLPFPTQLCRGDVAAVSRGE